jgi:hypothetical protein
MVMISPIVAAPGGGGGGDDGKVQALQKVLLHILRAKFGHLPRAIEKTITATNDVSRLQAWMDRMLRARTLSEVGIGSDE